jgi:septation ring formation regulator EzrA
MKLPVRRTVTTFVRLLIDDISKDVKGIKDDVKNLKRRMSNTEKTLSNIENIANTREELGEIQRRRSELVIFGLPEQVLGAQNDLKNIVFTELNKYLTDLIAS